VHSTSGNVLHGILSCFALHTIYALKTIMLREALFDYHHYKSRLISPIISESRVVDGEYS
jgi:hypothetical protein